VETIINTYRSPKVMQRLSDRQCRHHIFVCTNKREGDMPCCSAVDGEALFLGLKQEVMKRGLVHDVWVTKTGCQGLCNTVGATVVIYPQGIWLAKVTMEDIDSVLGIISKT